MLNALRTLLAASLACVLTACADPPPTRTYRRTVQTQTTVIRTEVVEVMPQTHPYLTGRTEP